MTLGYSNPQTYNNPWTYSGSLVPAALSTSVRSAMQTVLRTVPSILGENWWYQRLTSGPAAEARTYGTVTAVAVLVSARITAEEYDERNSVWKRRERARLRTSDVLADLHQGDQVIDPNGVFYAVSGIESSGTGTIAYSIVRDIPLRAGPNRGGGV